MARTTDERSIKIYELCRENKINEAALVALDECKDQIESIIYKNYKKPTKEHTDEINQLCYLELHKLVKKYDLERGCKFRTYSECYLKKIIVQYFKDNVYSQKDTDPYEYYQLRTEERETTYYVFDNMNFSIKSHEIHTVLHECIQQLPPKRRQVISLYYGFGNPEPIKNLEEIGDILGISSSTARVTKKQAENQLKKLLLKAA